VGRLTSKRCLITGAGAGIGRAAALLFASEGAMVAAADIDGDAARDVAREIEAAGGRASAHACDVTQEASMKACVSDAAATFGGLDVCWANAGTGDHGTVIDTPLEHFEHVLRVNLVGIFLTAKYAAPCMIDAGGGSLILTSSRSAISGAPAVVSNMAAKGGVLSLTRQMAYDFMTQKIRVNAICPGSIRTHALVSSMEKRDDELGLARGTTLANMSRASCSKA